MNTTIKQAKMHGGKNAIKVTIVAELIVFFILTTFLVSASRSFSYVFNLFSHIEITNLIIFISLSLLFSYMIGRRAAVSIIIKKRNHLLIAFIAGILAIVCSTMATSILIMVINILNNNIINDWFFYFFIKPLVWIIPVSIIPVTVAATWFAIKLNSYKK